MSNDLNRVLEIRPDIDIPDPPPLAWVDDEPAFTAPAALHLPPTHINSTPSLTAPTTRSGPVSVPDSPAATDLDTSSGLNAPSRGSDRPDNVLPLASARRRKRTAWLAGAAAVVVLIGGALIGRQLLAEDKPSPAAPTSTAPPSASPSPVPSSATVLPGKTSTLPELAQLAAAHEPTGTGTVRYQKLTVLKNPSPTGKSEVTQEKWVAPDQSGRVLSSTPDEGPDMADGEYTADQPVPSMPECREATPIPAQPADTEATKPPGYLSPAARAMQRLMDCARFEAPLSGEAQAALITFLAETEGVETSGQIMAHGGRYAMGFTVRESVSELATGPSGATGIVLFVAFDQITGEVLATVTTYYSAESPDVPLEATGVYVEAATMVEAIGDRP